MPADKPNPSRQHGDRTRKLARTSDATRIPVGSIRLPRSPPEQVAQDSYYYQRQGGDSEST